MADLFPGFATRRIATPAGELFARIAGSGRPVLLIHGYPQTHVTWHRMAGNLAKRFTVVIPDLPGYGASATPPSSADHLPYSKRAMGEAMAALMADLGHRAFAIVGHDRGARVGYRMALDQGARILSLVVLDIVPTGDMWAGMGRGLALSTFHWLFLAQPFDLPERLIGSDPDFYLDWMMRSWAKPGFAFDPAALAEYRAAFRRPSVIHATCEDYRAGATIDLAHDEADRAAGKMIECRVLALWGGWGKEGFDVAAIWRRWARQVEAMPMACGHFIPEEAPEAALAEIVPFLEAS